MAKTMEVSLSGFKYRYSSFPTAEDTTYMEILWNFFLSLDKLSFVTGVEPYTAVYDCGAHRVDVYNQASDPLSFAVQDATPADFCRSLVAQIQELLASVN